MAKSTPQQQAMLKRYAASPLLFVREIFKAEPDAWQADALDAIRESQRIAMSACKGPGKSCLLAWAIWWLLACHYDQQIIAVSITADNLRDNLWKELAFWHSKSAGLQGDFEIRGERIVNISRPKTWWCSARAFAASADASQQANTLAGLHAENVAVVLDEVGDYPEGVVSAAEGIFANAVNARLIVAGNPTSTTGPLYRISTKDRKRWHVVEITGDPDEPRRSPRISLQWAQQQIDDWGRDNDWVRVNVLGKFPKAAADRLISIDDVLSAQKRDLDPAEYAADARVWGLDPARFGDDESCLARRQGCLARTFKVWRGLDGVQLAQRVGQLLMEAEKDHELPDVLFVDVGGVGASAYDHLRLLGWRDIVAGVDFGGAPGDDRFCNKRSEMWWELAQWVKRPTTALPTDAELPGQLVAPAFSYKLSGKRTTFALEAKESLRKRGVGSPDRADALALTFAEPVLPKGLNLGRSSAGARSQRAVTDYDPLAEAAAHG